MPPTLRPFGQSDLRISRVGLGTSPIGGSAWDHSWGPQDDAESIAAIHRALDCGMNWIDTAPVYGYGHSEEVVGRAIRRLVERPYVFTKCTLLWDDVGEVSNVMERDSIRRECEASLRRLGVEVIDLYQIHWPIPDEGIDESWAALAELQREGKVRWIGVSNFNVSQMARAAAIAPITSQQPQYSLLARACEADQLSYCLEQGIGVIGYAPMAYGLLTGAMTRERIDAMPPDHWRRQRADYQEPNLSSNLALVDLLAAIGARHGISAAPVAVAWALAHPAVTGTIVGARSAAQVDGLAPALSFSLSDAELAEIAAFQET